MKKRIEKILGLLSVELLIAGGIFLLALFALSITIHEAFFEHDDIFDTNIALYFAHHSSPALITAMQKITFFGSSMFLLPAYIVLIGWHSRKRQYHYAVDIAAIGISSTALMFILKLIFHRHRPELPILKGITGYSFPSGHSLSSFIFCTILLYLLWKRPMHAGYKYLLTIVLLLYPLAIGLSRIVLNVHYATDVIGGFCLATVWVVLFFFVLRKLRKKKIPHTGGAVLSSDQ